ncbi:hypothetical protein N7470_004563 [Penicillium chermesinum]|nr:hypothetical protein N7470_004563 [Penicillium chermesinum]
MPSLAPVEDNSDGDGDIPFADAKSEQVDSPIRKLEDDDEEEDDDDDDEDVYVVEEIKDHSYQKKGKSTQLYLKVKWKGYDAPEDMTWEPEAGLQGAKEIVDNGPGRKRKSMGEPKPTSSATPEAAPKKKRKSSTAPSAETPAETDESDNEDNWVPRGNKWDDQVKSVDTIVRDPENHELYALLIFTNGKKSKVLVETCYHKCPYKICKFYESHLVFK